jgi:FAD/FMN-containing dehydrogenase
MSHSTLHPTILQDFKTSMHGEVINPADADYDNARRVWNGWIDKHPALIARCADVSDVINAIKFARRHDLTVAVRGGGHDLAGHGVCDDGLVIDLSQMKGIQVDPKQHRAHAQPGLTNAEFLRASQPFGLATPTGIVGHVGLSGLTLGGGVGWLSGRFGLMIDNLLAVEIVTADGKLLTASAMEHSDLFWAVRGGGGNFGVVTDFTFQLHPVTQVLRGSVIHPMPRTREVLHFYREYTRQVPDELTVHANLMAGPDGQPMIILDACYYGDDLNEGERVLAPLRTFGPPIVDLIRPMSVLEATTLTDAFSPPGRSNYSPTETLLNLNDEVIGTVIAYCTARPSPLSGAVIRHHHGAPTRIKMNATAYAPRQEHYGVQMIAQWTDGEAQPYLDWANRFRAAVAPFAIDLCYVNSLLDEGEERVRACYGYNYERLVQVKNRYDPTNFFHVNQNIKPTKLAFLQGTLI